ncbi:helix-turn-helix domain-containing protein [Dietzia maris]|uniref:helix-turn-helix domain-containing protein n=1 Tax=Dietzia maris TaxID=37915 RepID=UPI0037C59B16
MANTWLKDARLSAKAKGLICFMQSVSDNWQFTVEGLSTQFSDGRDSVRSGLLELKEAGYLTWEQVKAEEGAKFGKNVVTLHEHPLEDQSVSDEPLAGNPSTGNPTQQSTKEQSTDLQKTSTVVDGQTPVKFGRTDINEMVDYWQEVTGLPMNGRVKANRAACRNLIARHQLEGVKTLVRAVAASQADRFAPRIADFADLQAKQNQLAVWAKQQTVSNKPKGVVIE